MLMFRYIIAFEFAILSASNPYVVIERERENQSYDWFSNTAATPLKEYVRHKKRKNGQAKLQPQRSPKGK